MFDIGDLLDHLGHQDNIPCRIEIGKPGQTPAQLVAKNKP
jgi:hypothetical protein